FRKTPAIDRKLLKDSHLTLLASLANAPHTFEQLQAQIGFSAEQLTQALMALYFAGSITTDERFADAERLRVARQRATEAEQQMFGTSGSSLSEFGQAIP